MAEWGTTPGEEQRIRELGALVGRWSDHYAVTWHRPTSFWCAVRRDDKQRVWAPDARRLGDAIMADFTRHPVKSPEGM